MWTVLFCVALLSYDEFLVWIHVKGSFRVASANARRRYNVTSSLIVRIHAQSETWCVLLTHNLLTGFMTTLCGRRILKYDDLLIYDMETGSASLALFEITGRFHPKPVAYVGLWCFGAFYKNNITVLALELRLSCTNPSILREHYKCRIQTRLTKDTTI